MSEIRNLTRNGETFYPLTHVGGLLNNSGNVVGEINDIFDISEYNASGTPPTPAKYASLDLALAAIPSSKRKGGMSIRYIQSSDDKYAQYLYTNTDPTTTSKFTNPENWERLEGVDRIDAITLDEGCYNYDTSSLVIGSTLIVLGRFFYSGFVCKKQKVSAGDIVHIKAKAGGSNRQYVIVKDNGEVVAFGENNTLINLDYPVQYDGYIYFNNDASKNDDPQMYFIHRANRLNIIETVKNSYLGGAFTTPTIPSLTQVTVEYDGSITNQCAINKNSGIISRVALSTMRTSYCTVKKNEIIEIVADTGNTGYAAFGFNTNGGLETEISELIEYNNSDVLERHIIRAPYDGYVFISYSNLISIYKYQQEENLGINTETERIDSITLEKGYYTYVESSLEVGKTLEIYEKRYNDDNLVSKKQKVNAGDVVYIKARAGDLNRQFVVVDNNERIIYLGNINALVNTYYSVQQDGYIYFNNDFAKNNDPQMCFTYRANKLDIVENVKDSYLGGIFTTPTIPSLTQVTVEYESSITNQCAINESGVISRVSVSTMRTSYCTVKKNEIIEIVANTDSTNYCAIGFNIDGGLIVSDLIKYSNITNLEKHVIKAPEDGYVFISYSNLISIYKYQQEENIKEELQRINHIELNSGCFNYSNLAIDNEISYTEQPFVGLLHNKLKVNKGDVLYIRTQSGNANRALVLTNTNNIVQDLSSPNTLVNAYYTVKCDGWLYINCNTALEYIRDNGYDVYFIKQKQTFDIINKVSNSNLSGLFTKKNNITYTPYSAEVGGVMKYNWNLSTINNMMFSTVSTSTFTTFIQVHAGDIVEVEASTIKTNCGCIGFNTDRSDKFIDIVPYDNVNTLETHCYIAPYDGYVAICYYLSIVRLNIYSLNNSGILSYSNKAFGMQLDNSVYVGGHNKSEQIGSIVVGSTTDDNFEDVYCYVSYMASNVQNTEMGDKAIVAQLYLEDFKVKRESIIVKVGDTLTIDSNQYDIQRYTGNPQIVDYDENTLVMDMDTSINYQDSEHVGHSYVIMLINKSDLSIRESHFMTLDGAPIKELPIHTDGYGNNPTFKYGNDYYKCWGKLIDGTRKMYIVKSSDCINWTTYADVSEFIEDPNQAVEAALTINNDVLYFAIRGAQMSVGKFALPYTEGDTIDCVTYPTAPTKPSLAWYNDRLWVINNAEITDSPYNINGINVPNSGGMKSRLTRLLLGFDKNLNLCDKFTHISAFAGNYGILLSYRNLLLCSMPMNKSGYIVTSSAFRNGVYMTHLNIALDF